MRVKILMLGGSLFLLTACGGSIAGDVVRPPAAMDEPCAQPTGLPQRALTQSEVEIFWGGDRTALRNCGERYEVLRDLISSQADVRVNNVP